MGQIWNLQPKLPLFILLTTWLACWGHGDLITTSTASDIKFDLIFEISNLIYPGNNVHVATNHQLVGLWGHGGLQMTSEDATDLKLEISGLNTLCWHCFTVSKGPHEQNETHAQETAPIDEHVRFAHARKNLLIRSSDRQVSQMLPWDCHGGNAGCRR